VMMTNPKKANRLMRNAFTIEFLQDV
jgi:hypothetical protein